MKISNVCQSVISFCKSLTIKDFVYGILILFLIGLCSSAISRCSYNEGVYKNNIKALTDSVEYYRAKDGNLVATKTALISNVKDLEQLNKELYDKIKSLNVKPKEVISTVYLKGETEYLPQDTVYVITEQEVKNGIDKDFAFNNEWRTLEGSIGYHADTLGLHIAKDIVKFDYTVAVDKNNKIYIKSNNPYVTVNEISGFTIPEVTIPQVKEKRWGIGPQIGISYDMIHNKITPSIGVGIQWNLIRF